MYRGSLLVNETTEKILNRELPEMMFRNTHISKVGIFLQRTINL